MSDIEKVKQLRQSTGAGFKDCNAAIQEANGDLEKAVEFSIKWPRGELGSLPADSEQFMLIEHMAGLLESIQQQQQEMQYNAVNIKRLQEDVKEARENIEKLKDKVRANGSN